MIFCCNGCISSVRIDIWIPNQNGNNDHFDHGLFVHFEFTKTGKVVGGKIFFVCV